MHVIVINKVKSMILSILKSIRISNMDLYFLEDFKVLLVLLIAWKMMEISKVLKLNKYLMNILIVVLNRALAL